MVTNFNFGWVHDPLDISYYEKNTPEVVRLLRIACERRYGEQEESKKYLSQSETDVIDLSEFFTEIENQNPLSSCTAHTLVGLLEYFQKRSYGEVLAELSALFLFQQAQKLMPQTNIPIPGVSFFYTLNAFNKFGIAREAQWPFKSSNFDREPDELILNSAKEKGSFYSENLALKFFRLDNPGNSNEKSFDRDTLLKLIKNYLQAGFPLAFGFQTSDGCIQQAGGNQGNIPFPTDDEKLQEDSLSRRHAVIAVGYDNGKEIRNNIDQKVSKGALKIRNSWGSEWGNEGYGYLPYEYVLQRLARDWWTFIQNKWVETGKFGLPLDAASNWWGDDETLQPRR